MITLERHGARWHLNDPGGRIGKFLNEGRPYEYQLLDEIHERGLTGVAFDIGAHVGNHALYLAAVCGLEVWALEADVRTYHRLVDNVLLNPGLCIHSVCAAAGDVPGRGRIVPGMRVLRDDDGEVAVVRMDDIIDAPDLALIKVDVEGMEPEALAGCERHLLRCRPLVYAETHSRSAGRRIAAVLEPLGYQPTGRVQMGSAMERWEAA